MYTTLKKLNDTVSDAVRELVNDGYRVNPDLSFSYHNDGYEEFRAVVSKKVADVDLGVRLAIKTFDNKKSICFSWSNFINGIESSGYDEWYYLLKEDIYTSDPDEAIAFEKYNSPKYDHLDDYVSCVEKQKDSVYTKNPVSVNYTLSDLIKHLDKCF